MAWLDGTINSGRAVEGIGVGVVEVEEVKLAGAGAAKRLPNEERNPCSASSSLETNGDMMLPFDGVVLGVGRVGVAT